MQYFKQVFPWLIAIIILVDGLGILPNRSLIVWPILVLSIATFTALVWQRKLRFSYFLILWAFFLTITGVSTVYSSNFTKSIIYFVVYLSLIPIFLFVNQHKDYFYKKFLVLIALISYLFVLIFTIFQYINFTPNSGYQFIFPSYGSHNHLGDFLILILLILFYLLLTKTIRKYYLIAILTTILTLPYFLFSFSRSAYISFLASLVLMIFLLIKNKSLELKIPTLVLLTTTIGISILFIFSVVKTQNSFTNKLHTILIEKNLGDKEGLSSRNFFAEDAFESIMKKSVLGVGPGNYIDVSRVHTIIGTRSETSHNIFLDIFSENGIVAGVIFILILVELFRKSDKNLIFFLALAMIINFQTDYTYRIFSFLLLFFVLLALIYRPQGIKKDR